MRYFLEITYQGTNYNGWQVQHNAISVQQRLQESLYTLLKHPTEVVGSGRTDTGVHALQQFAHFDTHKVLEPYKFLYQLNAVLPPDIAVKNLYNASPDAHARFDALSRKYEYHIYQNKNPFLNAFALFYKPMLSLDLMNEAGQILLQHNDFQTFSLVNTEVNNFTCQIYQAEWRTQTDKLIFCIKANRFLRGMVRAIVGTMLWVGTQKINLTDFESIILTKNRSKAGEAVAPQGLYLTEITYPENFLEKVEI